LQDKIRTEQEKEREQESQIDQPDHQKPSEVIVCCSAEFHSYAMTFFAFNDPANKAD